MGCPISVTKLSHSIVYATSHTSTTLKTSRIKKTQLAIANWVLIQLIQFLSVKCGDIPCKLSKAKEQAKLL